MRRSRRQRGVALLLAVSVVAVLTLTVFPFVYEGRVERAVASNLYTSLQARHLAEGGVAIAEALLRLDGEKPGGDPYDGLDEIWAQYNNIPVAAGGGAVSMVITDEHAKLNLRRLVNGNTVNADWRSYLERLLVLVADQDAAEARRLVDALVDWQDTESTNVTGSGGAEETYYRSLTPPYSPDNAPLVTVAQLGLVRGWTPEIVRKVTPFVTVYGEGRVNPNTAPWEVLVAIGLDETQATRAVESRVRTPFRNINEFRQATGFTGNLNFLTYKSQYFGVTVTGSFRDSVAIVHTVLQRGGQFQRHYWRVE